MLGGSEGDEVVTMGECVQKNKSIQLSELFFILFLTLMFVMKGFGLYEGQLIYTILFLIAFGCLAVKVLLTPMTYFEWLMVAVLGVLVLIMNRMSGEKGPLIILAIVVGMKGISLMRVAKIGTVTFGISMLVKIMYHFLFLADSGFNQAPKLGMNRCLRWALGYAHPNTVAISYLALVIMIVYWLNDQYDWKYFVLLNFGNLFLNFFCLSYTGMLMTCGYLVLSYIAVHYEIKSKVLYGLLECIFPACILFSVFIPFVLSDKVMMYLKANWGTIHSRLKLARMFFTPENVSLWGVNVATLTDNRFTLDNSYLYCFVFNGMIAFGLISLGYVLLIHSYAKERKQKELAIILILLIAGIMEPFLFNSSFKNFSIFFLAAYLSQCVTAFVRKKQEKGIFKTAPCLFRDRSIAYACPFSGKHKKIVINNKTFVSLCIGSVIVLVASYLIERMCPVTEAFFSDEMLEKFALHQELSKGLLVEDLRRTAVIWAYLMAVGVVTMTLWKKANVSISIHKKE